MPLSHAQVSLLETLVTSDRRRLVVIVIAANEIVISIDRYSTGWTPVIRGHMYSEVSLPLAIDEGVPAGNGSISYRHSHVYDLKRPPGKSNIFKDHHNWRRR